MAMKPWHFHKETSTYVSELSDWPTPMDLTCAICGQMLDRTRAVPEFAHEELVAWTVSCVQCPGVARTKNPTRHKIFND